MLEPFIEELRALQNGHDCCDIGSICSREISVLILSLKKVSAMKIQQPFLNDSAEGRRMTVEIIS